MSKTQIIPVRLLGKELQVSCPSGKEQELLDAAYHLDQKMLGIRKNGRILGTERIAIMAALNATHDLLQQQAINKITAQDINLKIRELQNKIDNVLVKKCSNDLELVE